MRRDLSLLSIVVALQMCNAHAATTLPTQGVDIAAVVAVAIALARFALALAVAVKKGTFNRGALKVFFYARPGHDSSSSELVIGGPHKELRILTPVLLKLENQGTETSHDIEISVESDSCTVVNHPQFFVSPVATGATEAVSGDTIYLGSGVFRRVFKVSKLHPGKSVQLNNAGLPYNRLRNGEGIAHSSLKVSVFEPGCRRRELEFGVWHVDTSESSFRDGACLISRRLQAEYNSRPFLQRILIRLCHARFERRLHLMQIETFRPVQTPNEEVTFQTPNDTTTSEGLRTATGVLVTGPWGILWCSRQREASQETP